MPEDLLLYRDNPESKLWTYIANEPSMMVSQLSVTRRGSIGRVNSGSYIPNVHFGDMVESADIQMPIDGVFPVMITHSLGKTMIIGDRNIMQYGNVQTLTPGISVWEVPKVDQDAVPILRRTIRACETGVIHNAGPEDNKRLLGNIILSATTTYTHAVGRIENQSQYPVYIAACDDPSSPEVLGGMKIYGSSSE